MSGVEKFEDLPADLYQQFLHLSQVAYNGIKREEVIFHTSLPGSLGFLDAVSALYGGGGVSYNFLHLTVQEFFAAHHISHLGSSGQEVFKQHGKDKRWNVVWRFVAGLTKLKHYEGHLEHVFTDEFRGDVKDFFIQCLFEAQTIHHLKSFFKMSQCEVDFSVASRYAPLDLYALGYCLTNFHTGVSWELDMQRSDCLSPFISGLRSNMSGIGQSPMSHCADVGGMKSQPFCDLTFLDLMFCSLTNADLVHLSELIPHMSSLKKLRIRSIHNNDKTQLNLLKILHQLSHSNVVSLDISDTGFCRMLRDSTYVYSSALKQLVCPSSGKLEELAVGDSEDVDDGGVLASLVSAPSSLKSLWLWDISLSSHVSHLKDNTCLTELEIRSSENWSEEKCQHIIKILKDNTTLQDMTIFVYGNLAGSRMHITIDAIQAISNAISCNNTLRTLKIFTENSVSEGVENNPHQLDYRILIYSVAIV